MPEKAAEAMHNRRVILPPLACEPTQPDQQRDRRFPEDPIHLIEQPAEIVGEAILSLRRRRHRRGRDGGSGKRARCGIAVPDVGDGQDTGRDRALSSAAEGGPEQRSVLSRAEALRRPAATRLEILPAP